MLSRLFKREIYRRHMSYRHAAKEIGISHTTAIRVRDEANVDLSTIKKISKWLGTDCANMVPTKTAGDEKLYAGLLILLDRDPDVRKRFLELCDAVEAEEIPHDVIDEIVRYADFKIELRKRAGI